MNKYIILLITITRQLLYHHSCLTTYQHDHKIRSSKFLFQSIFNFMLKSVGEISTAGLKLQKSINKFLDVLTLSCRNAYILKPLDHQVSQNCVEKTHIFSACAALSHRVPWKNACFLLQVQIVTCMVLADIYVTGERTRSMD